MKKKVLSLLLMAAMVLGLAACGNSSAGEADSQPETASGTEAATETANVSGETVGEKTLVAGATTGFFGAESLDPAYNWDGWIMSIYGISENLFRLDDNLAPQPWLVENYESTDDTTWVFTLKEGITFSNGNAVTAEAVKKCFERTYEQNVRAGSTLKIDSMEAEGQILTVHTPEPNPTILYDLCDPMFGVYDSESEIDSELGASCTGPYVATSFIAMTEVKMDKNVNYWGGEPAIDHIDLKIMDDVDALNMAMQNGEIDLIAQLPAASASLFSDESQYTIGSATSTRSQFLQFNLESEAMKDVDIRKAISMCIDREGYADVVFAGYAKPSYAVYPDTLSYGGTDEINLSVDRYDPEGAKALVEAAGYTPENPLELKLITYSYNTGLLQLTDMLQPELKDIGINLTIETYDVLDDYLAAGDFDIAAMSYALAPTGNAQYLINMLFITGGSDNYGHYSNADVDAAAAELAVTFDTAERDALVKKITQCVVDECPDTFIASQQLLVAYNNRVSGVDVNPSEYYLITNTLDIAE
ncbi:MAG: ABC transporter substrate-binding protein [Coprococcus sp.]